MTKKQPETCGTCKFGDFWRKNGKIVRGESGRCKYVPVLPPLPLSITQYSSFRPEFSKVGIWPNMTDCPVYEKREPENHEACLK